MSYQFRRTSSLAIAAAFLLAACAGPSAGLTPTAIPAREPTAAPATGISTQGDAPAAATQAPVPTSMPPTALPATEPPIAGATETPASTRGDQPAATAQPLATTA